MVCDECLLLLDEYSEETRRYQRAVSEYRRSVSSGVLAEIDVAKAEVDGSHAAARLARNAYEQHRQEGCHEGPPESGAGVARTIGPQWAAHDR
jgi:hypothetical protein